MLTSSPTYPVIPAAPTEACPHDVKVYLLREGWIEYFGGPRPYFYRAPNMSNYYTWDQALIYTAFTKMNLGV